MCVLLGFLTHQPLDRPTGEPRHRGQRPQVRLVPPDLEIVNLAAADAECPRELERVHPYRAPGLLDPAGDELALVLMVLAHDATDMPCAQTRTAVFRSFVRLRLLTATECFHVSLHHLPPGPDPAGPVLYSATA